MKKSRFEQSYDQFLSPKKARTHLPDTENITYGEVFAGIGAANAAFLPLGWENVFFIENNTVALAQYLYNWDSDFAAKINATGLNYNQIYSLARSWQSAKINRNIYNVNGFELPKVDVLMTSPPCQSFSVANTGGKKGLEEKGDLFFETHRIIRETNPPVFILENVPGMLNVCEDPAMDQQCEVIGQAMFGPSWQMIKDTSNKIRGLSKCKGRSTLFDIILPSLGQTVNQFLTYPSTDLVIYRKSTQSIMSLKSLPYHLFYSLMESADYSEAPMARRRIFIVGFHKSLGITNFTFPAPWNMRKNQRRPIYDYVQPDAPMSTAFRYKKYPKNSPLWSNVDKTVTKIITPHRGLELVNPKAEKLVGTFTTKIRETDYNTGILMSSGDYRSLADEQMRALMGFPIGFNNSSVSFSGAVKNFGNSIAVPVLRALGESIQKRLMELF